MYLTDTAEEITSPPAPCPFRPRLYATFPLAELEAGQGFGMVGGPQDAQQLRKAIRNHRRHYPNKRFTVEKIGVGHWRCWRIS